MHIMADPTSTNKHRINVYVSIPLYTKLVQSSETQTVIMNKALELYFNHIDDKEESEYNSKLFQMQENIIIELQNQIKVKDIQIEKLTETMQAQLIHLQSITAQKQLEEPGK
jgi:hypothetical protein